MTDEEMRVVIAEQLGWKIHHGGKYCSILNTDKKYLQGLLDPINDLNAMHAAENFLLQKGAAKNNFTYWTRYIRSLTEMLNGKYGGAIHASAKERATIFIKTVCPEKWRE